MAAFEFIVSVYATLVVVLDGSLALAVMQARKTITTRAASQCLPVACRGGGMGNLVRTYASTSLLTWLEWRDATADAHRAIARITKGSAPVRRTA